MLGPSGATSKQCPKYIMPQSDGSVSVIECNSSLALTSNSMSSSRMSALSMPLETICSQMPAISSPACLYKPLHCSIPLAVHLRQNTTGNHSQKDIVRSYCHAMRDTPKWLCQAATSLLAPFVSCPLSRWLTSNDSDVTAVTKMLSKPAACKNACIIFLRCGCDFRLMTYIG